MDYLKYFKNDTLFEGNDNFFKKYIKKSYIYGEYGCGQSTYWVLKNTNVKIYSVDTSKHWINKLHKSKLTSKDRIDLKLINLGKIESWGYPVNYSKRDNFYKYTNWIWTQSELPDTILIDGRFRICCFFTCLKFGLEGTIIIFDDYINRPQYHIVEKYLNRYKIDGRQCIFKIPKKSELDLFSIEKEIINFRHVMN